MRRIQTPAEFKADGEKGEFSGYASIFENVDLGGDVIRKGAFKELVTNANGEVKVLFQHDNAGYTASGGLAIGLAKVEENNRGLKFSGRLVMEDPFVVRVHTHMKAGTLDGMSIGYDVLPGGANLMESGRRELTALKLWEISPVTFGMNPKAGILAVKAQGIQTLRDFEEFLSEAMWDALLKGKHLTRDDIKLLAAGGWKSLQSTRDALGAEEVDAAETVKGIVASIENFGRA